MEWAELTINVSADNAARLGEERMEVTDVQLLLERVSPCRPSLLRSRGAAVQPDLLCLLSDAAQTSPRAPHH